MKESSPYVWGGLSKSKLSSVHVHSFDPLLESWSEERCDKYHPPGLSLGACASAGHYFYVYGGKDGSNNLHQLDTKSGTWKQFSSVGPMRKIGCKMVAYGSKLALFGGYGYPSGPTQPGAEFALNKLNGNDGWTNELHIFDINKGEEVLLKFRICCALDSKYLSAF